MANIPAAPDGGVPKANKPARLMGYAGGVVSIALILGLGVWGARLILRDVRGIPVVEALEGPMRVAPEDPGGEVADHAGLAVNELLAGQAAAPARDQVTLAPQGPGIVTDDAAPQVNDDVGIVISDGSSSLTFDNEMRGLITAPGETDPQQLPFERPLPRPDALDTRPEVAPEPQVAEAAPVMGDDTAIPVGSHIVQLAALNAPEDAEREWKRISAKFEDFIGGRTPVIQRAEKQNGTVVYRLRLTGFDTRDDARRFCSALTAEGTACIALVVR